MPINGCCKGIFAYSVPSFSGTPIFRWDASNQATVLDNSGNPVAVNGQVTTWTDSVAGNNFTNTGANPAVLEEETRNGHTYRYIRNTKTYPNYMTSASPAVKNGYTIFITFRQAVGDHTYNEVFLFDSNSGLLLTHGVSAGRGFVVNTYINDPSSTDYTTRIWGLNCQSNQIRVIFPASGDPTKSEFANVAYTVSGTAAKMLIGSMYNGYPSSFCFYQIDVFNANLSDYDMTLYYQSLQSKWGIV